MENKVFNGSIFKGIDKIVSKDDLRPTMGVAYITKGNIVSTDAHVLTKINLKFFGLDEVSILKLEGKCIDGPTLQRLGSLKTAERWFVNDQGFNILKGSSGKVGLIYPLDNMEDIGKYPNFEAVIPTDLTEQSSTSLNAQLLLNIDKVYSSNGGVGKDNLEMRFHGRNRAITMHSSCDMFLGLIMPLIKYFLNFNISLTVFSKLFLYL